MAIGGRIRTFLERRALLAGYGLAPVAIYPQGAAYYGVAGRYFDALFVRTGRLPGWTA